MTSHHLRGVFKKMLRFSNQCCKISVTSFVNDHLVWYGMVNRRTFIKKIKTGTENEDVDAIHLRQTFTSLSSGSDCWPLNTYLAGDPSLLDTEIIWGGSIFISRSNFISFLLASVSLKTKNYKCSFLVLCLC